MPNTNIVVAEATHRSVRLSPNFLASDLLEAGETWAAKRIPNAPVEPATWDALKQLCVEILEPVRARFGPPSITYGFASEALTRHIKERICPSVDQHAGHERKKNGEPICKRLGQSVDFIVPGVSSTEVAQWIADTLPFDRLYFYGADRPIHVSAGPDNSRKLTAMLVSQNGRRTPRAITANWLADLIKSE